jgi:hypothetical protein
VIKPEGHEETREKQVEMTLKEEVALHWSFFFLRNLAMFEVLAAVVLSRVSLCVSEKFKIHLPFSVI